MGRNLNRNKSARNVNDVGKRMLQDFDEVQRRLNDSHSSVKLHGKPISKYALKVRDRKMQTPNLLQETQPKLDNEEPISSLYNRKVEYVLLPDSGYGGFEKAGFYVLNYIFADSNNNGYRLAFEPSILRSPESISENFLDKTFCRKLKEATTIKSKHQNFYLDSSGNLYLGDRENPRSREMTLVEKLES